MSSTKKTKPLGKSKSTTRASAAPKKENLNFETDGDKKTFLNNIALLKGGIVFKNNQVVRTQSNTQGYEMIKRMAKPERDRHKSQAIMNQKETNWSKRQTSNPNSHRGVIAGRVSQIGGGGGNYNNNKGNQSNSGGKAAQTELAASSHIRAANDPRIISRFESQSTSPIKSNPVRANFSFDPNSGGQKDPSPDMFLNKSFDKSVSSRPVQGLNGGAAGGQYQYGGNAAYVSQDSVNEYNQGYRQDAGAGAGISDPGMAYFRASNAVLGESEHDPRFGGMQDDYKRYMHNHVPSYQRGSLYTKRQEEQRRIDADPKYRHDYFNPDLAITKTARGQSPTRGVVRPHYQRKLSMAGEMSMNGGRNLSVSMDDGSRMNRMVDYNPGSMDNDQAPYASLLSEQIKDRRAREQQRRLWESNQDQRRREDADRYYYFGRQGGGAPFRTGDGSVDATRQPYNTKQEPLDYATQFNANASFSPERAAIPQTDVNQSIYMSPKANNGRSSMDRTSLSPSAAIPTSLKISSNFNEKEAVEKANRQTEYSRILQEQIEAKKKKEKDSRRAEFVADVMLEEKIKRDRLELQREFDVEAQRKKNDINDTRAGSVVKPENYMVQTKPSKRVIRQRTPENGQRYSSMVTELETSHDFGGQATVMKADASTEAKDTRRYLADIETSLDNQLLQLREDMNQQDGSLRKQLLLLRNQAEILEADKLTSLNQLKNLKKDLHHKAKDLDFENARVYRDINDRTSTELSQTPLPHLSVYSSDLLKGRSRAVNDEFGSDSQFVKYENAMEEYQRDLQRKKGMDNQSKFHYSLSSTIGGVGNGGRSAGVDRSDVMMERIKNSAHSSFSSKPHEGSANLAADYGVTYHYKEGEVRSSLASEANRDGRDHAQPDLQSGDLKLILPFNTGYHPDTSTNDEILNHYSKVTSAEYELNKLDDLLLNFISKESHP